MVARHFLTRKKYTGAAPQDMVSLYNLLDSEMFPSLKSVIQVALTVPVSSCSCERSFSALRRLRNWLRRTTGKIPTVLIGNSASPLTPLITDYIIN
ncbi:zinc finger MYM-type protein 1-like [Tachysurus ichikawai]